MHEDPLLDKSTTMIIIMTPVWSLHIIVSQKSKMAAIW